MKFVDAVWDTRSLRTPCAELIFGTEDGTQDVRDALKMCENYSYVAAKVPSGNMPVSLALQTNGFAHMEMSVEMSIDFRSLVVPRMMERFEQHISSQLAMDDSQESVFDHIREGIFDTDRIYLDPAFSHDLAATRYVNWIKDELERGATLHHVLYKGEEVGFYIYKERIPGVEAYPFLAGIYKEWRLSGFGTNVVCLEPLREAQRRGCKRIRTYVSSNNLPVLRAHEVLGYHVSDMQGVFVWHREGQSHADCQS